MIKSMPIKLIISFIVIVLLASIFYIPTSHAIGDIMGEGKGFLEASNGENSVINQDALKSTSDSIYNTLLAMAIIIAVIVAMVLGIQFMVAAADEKAKIKEALMPFIVGCIVVFGSFTIWKVFIDMGQSAEDSIVAKKPSNTQSNTSSNTPSNILDPNLKKHFDKWYEELRSNDYIKSIISGGLDNEEYWMTFFAWAERNGKLDSIYDAIGPDHVKQYGVSDLYNDFYTYWIFLEH